MDNLPESPDHENSPPAQPKSIPVLAKAEQNRALKLDRQIQNHLKEINCHFKAMAKELAEMNQRRLYFAFGFFTFEEYCRERLGKSRQYIYKIIQAHDFLTILENQGASEDDTNALTERLVREIRALPQYKQVLVTKAVARIKRQTGRNATITDVQAEAAKLDGGDEEQHKLERQQQEALSKIEGAARALKMGLSFDVLTPAFRRRITVALMSVAETVQALLAALESPVLARRRNEQSQQTHSST